MNGPGISRLRMNSIFPPAPINNGELGPPDFNGGMDMMGMLQQILPIIQQNKLDDQNYEQKIHDRGRYEAANPLPVGGRLNQIGEQVINPQQTKQTTMLPPTYNGMSAFENEKIKLGHDELRQKGQLGGEALDVKREGFDNSRSIAGDKLAVTKDLGQQRVDIAKQRADIYDFKAKHPNVQIIRTKGGTIQIYDPADRTTHDTGIDSGTLSDEDEIELRGKEARLTGDNASENRLGEIAARLAGQKELATNKPVSPMDVTITQNTKARELLAKYPSLANHLTQDAKGNYVSTAPEGSAASKLINDALYRSSTFGQDVNLPVDKGTVKPTKILKKDDDPLGLFKKDKK